MHLDSVALVAYTPEEEKINSISHACGLILSGLIVWKCLFPAIQAQNALKILCAALYLFGITVMFIASALYHGIKQEKAKKALRVADHCMIFFAVAGTASGCAPAVKDIVGPLAAYLMLCAAWAGACFGLTITFFGFGRHKALQMFVYIATALVCAICGSKAYFVLPIGAFLSFLGGSLLLIAGIIIYGLGRTRRYFHSVFHFFILGGLFVYWLGIAEYCY